MATSDALILALGVLGMFSVWVKNARWAVMLVYIPTLLLIPTQPTLDLSGLPDLNAQRSVAAAIVFAVVVSGDLRRNLPRRFLAIDWLVLAPVLSFAISYAVDKDPAGFFDPKAFRFRFPMLFLDWACPYLFIRGMVGDRLQLRNFLGPITIITIVLAILAAIECRLAIRFTVSLWNAIGMDLHVPPHWGDWRLGMLRAYTHFDGPITLGSVFVSLLPLVIVYGQLNPARRKMANAAAVLACIGVASCLSRGPALIGVLLLILFPMVVYRMRVMATLMGVALLFAIPTIYVVAGEAIAYTVARVEATGNTAGESGYYRIALLIIYGKQVANVGFWGRPELIGAGKYAGAYSIDNAYLFLFLTGGWIGGSLMLLINGSMLARAWTSTKKLSGPPRKFGFALAATFTAIALCMANVWFSPDYSSWYWVCVGLMVNLPQYLVGLEPRRVPQQASTAGVLNRPDVRRT